MKSKGLWQVIISIIPVILIGIIVWASSSEWWGMVWSVLLVIISIPCSICFLLGLKNIVFSHKDTTVEIITTPIVNKYLIFSTKTLSWLTVLSFSPLLFWSIDMNFNSWCVFLGLGISLYILFFWKKISSKIYKFIPLILIVLYIYIFYEMYQSWCLCLDPYASWNKPN